MSPLEKSGTKAMAFPLQNPGVRQSNNSISRKIQGAPERGKQNEKDHHHECGSHDLSALRGNHDGGRVRVCHAFRIDGRLLHERIGPPGCRMPCFGLQARGEEGSNSPVGLGGCPRISFYCASDCILACCVRIHKTVLDVQRAHLRRFCGPFLASQAHSKSRNEAILGQPPNRCKVGGLSCHVRAGKTAGRLLIHSIRSA